MAKQTTKEPETPGGVSDTVLGTINVLGDTSLADVLIMGFELILPEFAKRVQSRLRAGESPTIIAADIQMKGRSRADVDPVSRDVLATAAFAYASRVQVEAEAYKKAKGR